MDHTSPLPTSHSQQGTHSPGRGQTSHSSTCTPSALSQDFQQPADSVALLAGRVQHPLRAARDCGSLPGAPREDDRSQGGLVSLHQIPDPTQGPAALPGCSLPGWALLQLSRCSLTSLNNLQTACKLMGLACAGYRIYSRSAALPCLPEPEGRSERCRAAAGQMLWQQWTKAEACVQPAEVMDQAPHSSC